MSIVNGLPRFDNIKVLGLDSVDAVRFTNQFAIFGASPEFVGNDKIVFLDVMIPGAGGVVIKAADGTAISGAVTSPIYFPNPLRMDGGVILTGTVLIASGYYVQK